ncbi:hypothetical protein [Acidovorax sp. BLS4]|uniref:hypothetical protein n=1 Tax=Acidovorax sp. BLS4 TaxID=3273430 RepID=UPI002941FCBE|nr:hypothetical protein [Paracidovorax avenae]WOI48188.1 hypothetical protein R1Z03_24775 [Paracidovorax avenae]
MHYFGIAGSYELMDLLPEAFPDFVTHLAERGFVGGNVTVPHKEAAFRMVEHRDPAAEKVGAVNTIWLENGRLMGGNSDVHGFILIACILVDLMGDGLSMVYSFYDPRQERRSLGTFIILDHIVQATLNGLPYVYLGYWVPGSEKMAYKARFSPLEVLKPQGWMSSWLTPSGSTNLLRLKPRPSSTTISTACS